MTMKKYCCIILALALVLAGCSTAKPADSVSSTSETTETNLESISSNESTNPSAGEETSNANCYTIEEVANGAADGTVDEHGIEMFPEEATQKAQDAIMVDMFLMVLARLLRTPGLPTLYKMFGMKQRRTICNKTTMN